MRSHRIRRLTPATAFTLANTRWRFGDLPHSQWTLTASVPTAPHLDDQLHHPSRSGDPGSGMAARHCAFLTTTKDDRSTR
ncbi:hypothetical protein Aglo03_52410 [Actinokineospora globicatena]|uniref:Uncharacterized protein n=1 Tax=Actinokineospora globicatena TaxID=103729 RepID=A0A9W6QQX1_9PSEU|nr:hypothetical protein Aglo03_52410 [Actinokineospora globicatena]